MNILNLLKLNKKLPKLSSREQKKIIKQAVLESNREQLLMVKRYENSLSRQQ